ncbi:MAG TPA: ABC transporter permease, partial [Spirochaetia bacterium]
MKRFRRVGAAAYPFAVLFLLLLGAAAVTAPLVSPRSPTTQDLDHRFHPPGGGFALGSDDLGRDVLSRIIWGSRSALLVGVVSVVISAGLGTMAGLAAGLGPSAVDNGIMLLMDGLLSFPTVLLAITVVSFLGYGLAQVTIALGVIYSPTFARIVRAETLVLKTEGYVEAARALGTPLTLIVARHIVPNLLGKVIVQGSTTFSLAIVVEASLSYLGLGTQPPAASWGLML